MAEPFVVRLHCEPLPVRRDVHDPEWGALEAMLRVPQSENQRLELYGRDELTVMSIELHQRQCHVSIHTGETRVACLSPAVSRSDITGTIELGPFAFDAAEVFQDADLLTDAAKAFWTAGDRTGRASWSEFDTTNALSPQNNTMNKASAEVGAMVQAFEAGKRGGDASLRIKGEWNASPATRADIKLLARWLEVSDLRVIDADGSSRHFTGNELLPVAQGGKRW